MSENKKSNKIDLGFKGKQTSNQVTSHGIYKCKESGK